VEDCLFWGNYAEERGGGLLIGSATNAQVSGCTFAENGTDLADHGGSGIYASAFEGASTMDVSNCIVVLGTGNGAIQCDGEVTATFDCNDIWENENGPGCAAGSLGQDGNFAADPLFCDLGDGDLGLQEFSPCLPGNHPSGADCGLIGAFEMSEACAPPVGIHLGEDSISKENVRVRPVPSDGIVFINLSFHPDLTSTATIFDVQGRAVRSLVETIRRDMTWDGRNDAGRLVAGGVYFLKVKHHGSEITRRVHLVR
jgi:hypothetical protein